MIQKTIQIALSIILIVTTMAVTLAVGSFMITGYGYLTLQAYGSINNLIVTLFLIVVSSLLLIGNIKLSRPWMYLGSDFEAGVEVVRPEGLQTKKGSTSSN